MPNLLEDLIIDRVDLVDEGANSAAFISLYKRKEQNMDIKEIIEKMTPEHASVVTAELTRLGEDVTKAKKEAEVLTDKLSVANTDLVKAKEDLKTAEATCVKAKEDLKTAETNCVKAQEELETLKAGDTPFDEEETMKSMPEPARQLFTKMKQQKELAEETVRKAKEAEEEAVAIAKATELKALPVEQEKLVSILKSGSSDLFDVLSAVAAAMDGTVFGEFGKLKPGEVTADGEKAWDSIDKAADKIMKEQGITKAKAITIAVNENPNLYKEYLKGGAN